MGDCIKPLISIVIPVYNAADYIEQCINSVINQTYKNFELIVIDDGSTDQSYQILQKINTINFTLIKKENSGVSDTRNLGIDLSIGDIICFVDADDYIEEKYLEVFVNHYQNPDTLLIQDVYRSGNPKANYQLGVFAINNDLLILLNRNKLLANGGPVAKFYSAQIIKQQNIRFIKGVTYGEDLIFFLTYLNYVKYITYLNYVGYIYNYNNFSASTKKHSFSTYLAIDQSVAYFIDFNKISNVKELAICYHFRWDFIQSAIDRSVKITTSDFKLLRKIMNRNFLIYSNTKFRKLIYILIQLKQYSIIRKLTK